MQAERKSRGRGTIVEKGPGRWLVRVSLGTDPATGKRLRINRMVHGTKREAQQVLTETLGKADKGSVVVPKRVTLSQWLDEYAATWSGHLGPRTREQAEEALRRYLSPVLQGLQLAKVTPRLVQDHYNALLEEGKAPATVSLLHRTLRSRLNKAVELGLLARNPLDLVNPPRVTRRQYRALSPQEARIFLDEASQSRHGALWGLLLLTGLRPGEALGLKWEDLAGNALRVRRALLDLDKGPPVLDVTKTKRGRTVQLPGSAVRILQRHRAQQAQHRLLLGTDYEDQDLVFAADFGGPLAWRTLVNRSFRPLRARLALRLAGEDTDPPTAAGRSKADYRRAWAAHRATVRKALSTTGLNRFRPYDLRHSAATLLLAAGEHPKVVSEILGHARISLTLDTYSHVTPDMQGRAAERLEQVIFDPAAAAGTG